MQLSKSRFTTGLQCHRRLWWTVHERDAPELQVDASLQVVFDHGSDVGEVARGYIPGGVLIDLPYYEVKQRIRDLLPIVRNHVYHPYFGGGFGLKRVLPALVPGLSHTQLEIQDGGVATAELERLIFRGQEMPESERGKLRSALLAYCRLDTLALVKIVKRLREIGRRRAPSVDATKHAQ